MMALASAIMLFFGGASVYGVLFVPQSSTGVRIAGGIIGGLILLTGLYSLAKTPVMFSCRGFRLDGEGIGFRQRGLTWPVAWSELAAVGVSTGARRRSQIVRSDLQPVDRLLLQAAPGDALRRAGPAPVSGGSRWEHARRWSSRSMPRCAIGQVTVTARSTTKDWHWAAGTPEQSCPARSTNLCRPIDASGPYDPRGCRTIDTHQSRRNGEPPMSQATINTPTAANTPVHHPSVLAEADRKAADIQFRVAAVITRFAGSMAFVYLHVVVFAGWMLFVEQSPWPTLTLVVSLEAIFLSTFVMIGQNRSAKFQQDKANHDFVAQEQELHINTDLTRKIHQMTTQIAELTHQMHDRMLADTGGGEPTVRGGQ